MSKLNSLNPKPFKNYNELESTALICVNCELSDTRQNVVFSSGPNNADIMVIGEAPGAQEDITGIPFIGRSGKVMDQLFSEVGISRDDIYVTSILKCRPPENRNPKSIEISRCSPFLESQIEFVKPKIIVTVGNFSARHILKTKVGIKSLRGNFYPFGDIKIVPTLHPAYVLRNGLRGKNEMLDDLKLVRKLLDEVS